MRREFKTRINKLARQSAKHQLPCAKTSWDKPRAGDRAAAGAAKEAGAAAPPANPTKRTRSIADIAGRLAASSAMSAIMSAALGPSIQNFPTTAVKISILDYPMTMTS
jgi:hypothetical protein